MGKLLSYRDYIARMSPQIPKLIINLEEWGQQLMSATKELESTGEHS